MYLGQSTVMNGVHTFPEDMIPEHKKDRNWYKKWCQAILAEYYNDRCFPRFSDRAEMAKLRAYGASAQPESEAMTKVYTAYGKKKTGGGAESKRSAWHNIDPTILPVMDKFKQTILGKFQDIEYSVMADATDSFSTSEKEDMKFQALANNLLEDIVKKVNAETGTPNFDDGTWKPKNAAQAQMFEELGGFRLAAESAIEKAVGHSFRKEIPWKRYRERIINDLLDFGFAAIPDVTDPDRQVATAEYLDPEFLITQYDHNAEFTKIKFWGDIKSITIDELRKTGEFKESQLKNIASNYFKTNISNNASRSFSFFDRYNEATGSWGYDAFRVDIVRCRWRGFVTEVKEKILNNKGQVKQIVDCDFGDAAFDWDNENIYQTNREVWYKGTHIIGTNHVFDFGYEYDIMRNQDMTLRDPLNIVRLEGLPFTKRCLPNLRQIQLTWIKIQGAIAKARNSGLAIEYNSISNMAIKDDKASSEAILEIVLNDGSLVYKATTKRGTINVPGGKPIYELEGGMGKAFDDLLKAFELNRRLIQEYSGITAEASGGQDVPERQSAQLSEYMYKNTEENLKPVIGKVHQLQEMLANNLALRIQNIIKYSDKGRKKYQDIMGKVNCMSVLAPDGRTLRDLGISLMVLPDAKIKESILMSATESLKTNKQDGSGIDESDFIMITMMLERGKVNDSKRYLALKIRENKQAIEQARRKAEEQARAYELQMKDKELEMLKEKNRSAEEKIKIQEQKKIDYLNAEWDRRDKNERLKRGLDQEVDNEQSESIEPAFNR